MSTNTSTSTSTSTNTNTNTNTTAELASYADRKSQLSDAAILRIADDWNSVFPSDSVTPEQVRQEYTESAHALNLLAESEAVDRVA